MLIVDESPARDLRRVIGIRGRFFPGQAGEDDRARDKLK
jgi:hypothetical protein